MKKTVAVFIVFYLLAMGTMVVWGFIDKQVKENSTTPSDQSVPNPSDSPSGNGNPSTDPSANATSPSNDKQYSLSEVAKHKTQNNCWIVISGNVYDVTKYLDFHPGGADLILMYCGKDATQAFATQGGRGSGHSNRAKQLLGNYLVGVVK